MAPLLAEQSVASRALAEQGGLQPCSRCGSPTTGQVCAFCRLVERASAHEPVTVEEVSKGRRR
jgi:methylphosphotriester-DNA--protein-cysteine methyltransferase